MGLLRTAARASVATRVVGNTHRRQQQKWASQDASAAQQAAAAAPPPAPVAPPVAPAAPSQPQGDPMAELRQLGELRAAGILSEAEFEAAKQPILARMTG